MSSTYEINKDLNKNIFISYQKTVDFINASHFHRSIELHYILNGPYRFKVANCEYTAQTDSLVFIPSCFSHSAPKQPHCVSYVVIAPDHLCGDFNKIFHRKLLPFTMEEKEFNRGCIYPIFKQLAENAQPSDIVIKGYLNLIFGNLLAHYQLQDVQLNKHTDLVLSVIQYIETHFREPLTLESLSAVFGYNKTYFSRIFNQILGTNVKNYINFIRIQYFLQQYRQDTSQKITNLIFSCGFNSLPTFYRNFKEIYDTSPAELF
ncbi:MAG: hypothetical protein DBX59_02340 [Bacillota bacterium]|nr:MAG: hypothetical protein DBX59_02340 [Bacillota bacterium]